MVYSLSLLIYKASDFPEKEEKSRYWLQTQLVSLPLILKKKKDKKSVGNCTPNEAAAFAAMTGSWKSYRMHVTISGSCDNVTGTWKVTEWCEGVDETYNASVARVNGTLKGKMQNGYLQLDVDAPPSPNNKSGTKVKGSCSVKSDGTLNCSFGCPGDLKKQ